MESSNNLKNTVLVVAIVACVVCAIGWINASSSSNKASTQDSQGLLEEDVSNYNAGMKLYQDAQDTCNSMPSSELSDECSDGVFGNVDPGYYDDKSGDENVFSRDTADQYNNDSQQ